MVGPRRPECRDMSLSRGAGAYVTYDIDESDSLFAGPFYNTVGCNYPKLIKRWIY